MIDMADQHINVSRNLPFISVSDSEFDSLFGSWSDRIKNNQDLYDLLPNPDKSDECDPDLMLSTPCSDYYSLSKLSKTINESGSKKFTLFHCNIRSLPKNLHILEDTLDSLDHKLNIIGISETKLNEFSIVNVDIKSYHFFHTDSITKAGGAALYIAENLKAIPRPDIKFNLNLVESCWSEINNGNKQKPIIVGCIYRHPKCDLVEFTNQSNSLLKVFNNKYQIFILGDFNIDFLRINTHPQTEAYLNMIYANGLLPIVTKPTRITNHTSTLIDHIYTNTTISQITSGIAIADLSDHLPVFCIVNSDFTTTASNHHYRDYSNFKAEVFLAELNMISWDEILAPYKTLNEKTQDLISIISTVIDRHVPIKHATRSKQKLIKKNWISSGILKSIKKKQKMYKSHFLSNDPNKKIEYKRYANILNNLKNKSKTDYYKQQFSKSKDNLKFTWKIIGQLIQRKTKGQALPTRISVNDKVYVKEADIAEEFNKFFVNIGPSLADKIKNDCPTNPVDYISNSPSSSCNTPTSILPFCKSEC